GSGVLIPSYGPVACPDAPVLLVYPDRTPPAAKFDPAISTMYVPGMRPLKRYDPSAPVVVVSTCCVPVASSRRTVTPARPGSLASLTPLLFVSTQTTLPIDAAAV